jgi:transcription-repair coupling factor (superfamily II helicase)
VDPAPLVQLIQTRPKEFKLDGGERLRFFRDMADPAERVSRVAAVLGELARNP